MKRTEAQVKATERNWLKARLIGFPLARARHSLTKEERELFDVIEKARGVLINEWEQNSIRLGMFPRKKTKLKQAYDESNTKIDNT